MVIETANVKVVTPESGLNVADYMEIMDIAEKLRKKEKDVEKQFSVEELRAKIRVELLETYKTLKQDISEEQIDKAVNDYFSTLHEFEPPKKDFMHTLSSWYVDRPRIWRKYGRPIVIGLLGASAIYGGTKIVNYASETVNETNVEEQVEPNNQPKIRLESLVNDLSKNPLTEKLPASEKADFLNDIQSAKEGLTSLDGFFKKYCSDGVADDLVTLENYSQVEAELNSGVTNNLKDIESGKLSNASNIINTQSNLMSLRNNLDASINEIKNTKPEPQANLIERATSLYNRGLSSVEHRKLEEGKGHLEQLVGIKNDIRDFAELPIKVDQLYNGIKAVAKEEKALRENDKLYIQAKSYLDAVNVSKVRDVLEQLRYLDEQLNQEYTLVITGGKWRYKVDNPSIKNYYLIVEARNNNDRKIRKSIRNEEEKITEEVTEWGERVPEGAYEQVKDDKTDDGIIDDDMFGKKEKGYLTEILSFTYRGKPLQKVGQITRW